MPQLPIPHPQAGFHLGKTGSMLRISDVRRCETPSPPPEQYLIPADAPRDVVSSLWQLWLRMAGFSALGKECILCLPPPYSWTSPCGQGDGLCDYRREVHTARSLGTCEKSFPLLWNCLWTGSSPGGKQSLEPVLEGWGRTVMGTKSNQGTGRIL